MTRCVDFTVAIPTYNGESRLPEVLERLRSQINTEQISWEIIVVDNNSTDATARVVEEYQAHWYQEFPLRYVWESEQGVGFARQRAIEEATGEIVGFLDDDNLPAPNWVVEAYKFAREHPQAGAYGSQIHGVFEVEPPQELKPIIFYLAIVERGPDPVEYEPRKNGVPPGAGLVVRRKVWQECVPPRLFLVGRSGKSLLPTGQDAEALLYIHQAGWKIWYNPAMEINHLIPSWRLEKKYLMHLERNIGLGRYYLRMLALQRWQRPFASLIYLINDLRKVIFHRIRYHQAAIEGDVAAACEMERLVGTLVSPFYFWRVKLKNLIKNF